MHGHIFRSGLKAEDMKNCQTTYSSRLTLPIMCSIAANKNQSGELANTHRALGPFQTSTFFRAWSNGFIGKKGRRSRLSLLLLAEIHRWSGDSNLT